MCSYKFYHDEARTVCKQLGYKDVENVFDTEMFGDNFDLVTSVYFDCNSHDKSLSKCDQHQRPNVDCEATAVRCLQTGKQNNVFSELFCDCYIPMMYLTTFYQWNISMHGTRTRGDVRT